MGSSGRAASGTDASRVIPVSLDAGWTGGTTAESPIVSFSSTPPPSPDGGSSGGAPAVTQQFGAPGVGTCDEQADPALDWAGVSAGGWGRSWAWWMNEGLGGDVCNRTLVSGPNGQWMVS